LGYSLGAFGYALGALGYPLGALGYSLGALGWCLGYSLGAQKNPEASRCKYLGLLLPSYLNWVDQVNYTAQKAWKALHTFRVLKKGNRNTKCLAYTSLVCPILEYGSACWDPCREGQISAFHHVQKKAAQFTDHTKDSE